MYEVFTDRARKLMQLANQEALRFNCESVGTEHVLLALVVEGRGVAANVLRSLNVNLPRLRLEVETFMKGGPQVLPWNTTLPQTLWVGSVLRFAMEEARYMSHNYVGTEHLLLGLLHEDEAVAAQLLKGHCLELHAVRNRVIKILESGVGERIRFPQPACSEIEDLPTELMVSCSELYVEVRRLNLEKERAVEAQDFEKAAALRDEFDKIKRRKKEMIADWVAAHPADPTWLSWCGGAVLKLAERINERWRWDALPELANALEQAGCTDAEILNHCREPGEHTGQCWVVDLLLAKSAQAE